MAEAKKYLIKNRSAGTLGYTIPELNIKRFFSPGEIKEATEDELKALSYQQGGKTLLRDYLVINNKAMAQKMNGQEIEPEYYMTEAQIIDLIKNGSQDQWLDTLDFAPTGVIDLIKDLSVKLPITDYNKMVSFKQKIGFDLEKAISNMRAVKADEEMPTEIEDKKERRVKKEEEPTSARRSATPKYKEEEK